MNIGFFTDVYTPLVDGVVKSIILYKNEMEKLGHNVYVFAPKKIKSKSKVEFKWDIKDDDRTFRFKAIDSVFIPGYPLSIPISFKASKKIPKLKLDIVHCHTPVTLGMLGDIVALLQNIPKVYTYHTFYPEYADHYIKLGKFKTKNAVQKFDIFYCNRSDRVMVPSPKLKKILLEWGVKSPIEILPTGIDPQEFEDARRGRFRRKHHISEDKKILLFVGRLGTEKNVDFLIEAANKLKNRDFELFIVGDGKIKNELQAKVKKLNMQEKIKFTGFLSRQDTLDAFAGSDVFLFASKTDTQGLVILEAAYTGKPIVMVDDPGLGKTVIDGENGFLVPENTKIFANKVDLLLNDQILYDKMSLNSKRIARELTISNQSKKLLGIYGKVIDEYKESSLRLKFWQGLNKEIKVPKWLKNNKTYFNNLLKKSKNLFKFN